jgi:proteasome lid subunit RPN8/RPN11
VPTRNLAERRTTRFLIDPRNHLDALRAARRRGLDVVGFYHSHPRSGAAPSATDIAEASYPGCVHAIVGLGAQPPDVRLFRIADGNFVAIEYVTVD